MAHTVRLTSPAQREYARRLIAAAPDYAVVTVKAGDRTLAQNAKLWAMISDVSRAKPEGRIHIPEVWKCLFMAACQHQVQFETGLDGKPFPVGFRSSRLTKSEMADLITVVQQYGDKHGVKWGKDD